MTNQHILKTNKNLILLVFVVGGLVPTLIKLAVFSDYYQLAGVLPLFPFFAIIEYVVLASSGDKKYAKITLLITAKSMLAYLSFCLTVLIFVELEIVRNTFSVMAISALVWILVLTLSGLLTNRRSFFIFFTSIFVLVSLLYGISTMSLRGDFYFYSLFFVFVSGGVLAVSIKISTFYRSELTGILPLFPVFVAYQVVWLLDSGTYALKEGIIATILTAPAYVSFVIFLGWFRLGRMLNLLIGLCFYFFILCLSFKAFEMISQLTLTEA